MFNIPDDAAPDMKALVKFPPFNAVVTPDARP